MTETETFTAGTATQLEKARATTEARRVAEGRPVRKRDRGPMAELLAEAGFTAEKIRSIGRSFAEGRDIGLTLSVGRAACDAFAETFQVVADRVERGESA